MVEIPLVPWVFQKLLFRLKAAWDRSHFWVWSPQPTTSSKWKPDDAPVAQCSLICLCFPGSVVLRFKNDDIFFKNNQLPGSSSSLTFAPLIIISSHKDLRHSEEVKWHPIEDHIASLKCSQPIPHLPKKNKSRDEANYNA